MVESPSREIAVVPLVAAAGEFSVSLAGSFGQYPC